MSGLLPELSDCENYLCSLRGGVDIDEDALGVHTVLLEERHRRKGLRELCATIRPDVAQLHLYSSTLLTVLRLRSIGLQRPRIVATFHSPLGQWSWRHRFALRSAIFLCDAVVGASEHTARELRRFRSDVVQASPPIAIQLRDDIDRQPSSPRDTFRIVGVGRLSREKCWQDLIKAVARLPEAVRTQVSCRLIGEGSERPVLEAEIASLGLGKTVSLVGRLERKETLREVEASDLMVLPSRFEGFGMAAVEAMMLGVPVVTSEFPASAEYIVAGTTGHSFPIGDYEELARIISWHVLNRVESRTIGAMGQETVRQTYSPAAIAQIYRQMYQSLKLGRT